MVQPEQSTTGFNMFCDTEPDYVTSSGEKFWKDIGLTRLAQETSGDPKFKVVFRWHQEEGFYMLFRNYDLFHVDQSFQGMLDYINGRLGHFMPPTLEDTDNSNLSHLSPVLINILHKTLLEFSDSNFESEAAREAFVQRVEDQLGVPEHQAP